MELKFKILKTSVWW